MQRPEYLLTIKINGRWFRRVIIDQHYRIRHSAMNDELILKLVQKLHGQDFQIEMIKEGFDFFRAEPVFCEGKPYRLILLQRVGEDFLGVVNAFRVTMR